MKDGIYAKIVTDKGDIIVKLEYKKVPLTCASFIGLAEGKYSNKKFYDGLKFHRVVDNFVIQGGCPNGNGTGGPGYKFNDEIDLSLVHSKAGILSMANSGPNSNGSQFFITLAETPWLDTKHTVFGEVVEGLDVVFNIKQDDKIKKVEIIREGSDAKSFKITKEEFFRFQKEGDAKKQEIIKAAAQAQLKEILKSYPNAEKQDNGLYYLILSEGSGDKKPSDNSVCKAHYIVKYADNHVLDDSYSRNQPIDLPVGSAIEGWNIAIKDMKKGERRIVIIPPELGYGIDGYGVARANSYLIFEIELLDFYDKN